MKRGEIWWTKFDNSIGTEIKKTRPSIIVSNDFSIKTQSRVQAIPITSNMLKLYPCETVIVIKGNKYKAMADQIITVSKLRCIKRIGEISDEEMKDLERAIKLQLKLD